MIPSRASQRSRAAFVYNWIHWYLSTTFSFEGEKGINALAWWGCYIVSILLKQALISWVIFIFHISHCLKLDISLVVFTRPFCQNLKQKHPSIFFGGENKSIIQCRKLKNYHYILYIPKWFYVLIDGKFGWLCVFMLDQKIGNFYVVVRVFFLIDKSSMKRTQFFNLDV